MGAVPRSLLIAVRDIVILLVVASACSLALCAWATYIDQLDWWRHSLPLLAEAHRRLEALTGTRSPFASPPAPTVAWDWVARTAAGWAGGLSLWIAACWIATRARAGRRTVWVPVTVAAVVVVTRSLLAFPGAFGRSSLGFPELWPGPATPGRLAEDGSVALFAWHPGWAFPPLVVALLVAASWLGSRAGRLPDDGASRHVVPAARGGRLLAAAVVGPPAVGGASAAAVGYVLGTRDAVHPTTHSVVLELVAPLALAVLTAVLLSGTGPLGVAVTALASVPVVLGPMLAWAALRAGELAIVEAAGAALLCTAVALWRPCTTWAADLLAPVHRPPVEPPPWAGAVAAAPPSGAPEAP